MSRELQKHIEQFFQIESFLGSGAYGHVWKVIQKSSQKTYALKKIFDAFQNDIDAQRTYREITILHEIQHPNIIKLKAVIKSKNQKDLYLLFQHEQTDLHSLVGQNILQIPHLVYITYQIFKSLKFIHSAQLIHRDLKPSNILINSDCQIKLCDFGLVRSLTKQQNTQLKLTEDVATRWYRSPQMILGSENYGPATDIWSVGCIIAELLIGQPIMMGDSNIQQLQKILQLTGIPKKQDIQSLDLPVAGTLFQKIKIIKKPFFQYFKGSKFEQQRQFIWLISRMLEFNPSKRITVQQVLDHQFFSELRCKNEQIMCKKMIIPEIDDNIRLDVDDYKQSIYKDIQRRYPQFNPPEIHFRYLRGHNSLVDRKTYNDSISRKNCNSLLRPTRKNDSFFIKHELLVRPNRVNQFSSGHQYKISNKSNEKNFYSTHLQQQNYDQNYFNNGPTNLSTNQNSQKNQKSPLKKFKRQYLSKKAIKQQLQIQGLKRMNYYFDNSHQKQNKKSPIKKLLNPYLSSNSLFRKQQKRTLQLKNDYSNTPSYPNNKIHRKVFNRQKKQLFKEKRKKFLQKQSNVEEYVLLMQNQEY